MKRLFPWILPALILALGAIAFILMEGKEAVIRPAEQVVLPPEQKSEKITLMFVGDIMLSRRVGDLTSASGDWRYPFLKIGGFTSKADMLFGNLETSVSDRGRNIGSIYSFRSDPRTVEGLKYAGFDVVSLANNHIWDYATEAFLDTQEHLRNAGIAYAGGGSSYEEAHRAAILDVKGTKIAVLAYTNLLPQTFLKKSPGPTSAGYEDWAQVVIDIEQAKAQADIVVVSYHWGDEYDVNYNPQEERIAKASIDAGADLIIGHHPHVQQEIERYKDGWIAYSLGNFVFDQYFQPEVMQSRIFEVTLEGNKIIGARDIPVTIPRTSQPELAGDPIIL